MFPRLLSRRKEELTLGLTACFAQAIVFMVAHDLWLFFSWVLVVCHGFWLFFVGFGCFSWALVVFHGFLLFSLVLKEEEEQA